MMGHVLRHDSSLLKLIIKGYVAKPEEEDQKWNTHIYYIFI